MGSTSPPQGTHIPRAHTSTVEVGRGADAACELRLALGLLLGSRKGRAAVGAARSLAFL